MFFTIDIALLTVCTLFVWYLALLSVLALAARKRSDFGAARQRQFAIVIPAHDEENSIGRTITSLSSLSYPADRYDVLVVADNCTDATASRARALGATVYERHDELLRGKGYALRWMFDKLLATSPGYDAVIVIDADSVASPEFLTVMNWHLERGDEAIQCNDMVERQAESWISEIIRFGFTLYNYVRPMGRRVLGFSAGIRGNGMCFSTALLRRRPWDVYSLNEDLEYGLKLLLDGTTVAFAAEATVHAMMPATPKSAESQRSRWERGRFPVIRTYTWPLLKSAVTRLSLTPLDALVDLLTPPFVNLVALVLLLATLHAAAYWGGIVTGALALAWWIALAGAAVHVAVGMPAAGADRELYKAFAYIPRYALWKLSLYFRWSRRRSGDEWIRTTRDGASGTQVGNQPDAKPGHHTPQL